MTRDNERSKMSNGTKAYYEAKIDEATGAMFNRETGERLDAIAVIPTHAPDLQALVDMLTPEVADDLAWMAARRAGWRPVDVAA
ncbi:hypothetical protein [Solilutibacter silvestris]|uniref:Uncharacterized protein n=1 Tax=Solilutibacter silvestris TaxID=1645665 RepID=A0A2K1Q3G5_9GAMM|nr:hypothetical protein [Lysobacter silvestris]PNS09578.1 hypothetical protein Lysil_1207 [Lysobacter silvestris]